MYCGGTREIAIPIPAIRKIKTTRRYLSTSHMIDKTIYLFDWSIFVVKNTIKILEIIGLVLIGGTVYSFLGMIGDRLQWPVFFGCAAGTLAIIIYRKKNRQRQDKQ